jgi:hypothetical protein
MVHTIGLQPDYFSIGNEPTQWTHYGIPWSHWSAKDHSTPTSLAYAFDVRAAIKAVLVVDPTAKFVGVEAACYCNPTYFTDVGKIDGSLISAVAYHSYPSIGDSQPTLGQFYAPLASSGNLSTSYADVRADLVAGCSTCSHLPIFVNEYNAGPGWSPSNLGGSYANAVFLAASVTEAIQANVSQLTIFNLQTSSTQKYGYSLINGAGTVGDNGILFSKFLSHLVSGYIDGSHVATTIPGIYDVVTRNGSNGSILVVNTNLTHSLALTLGTGFGGTTLGTALYWSSSSSAPLVLTGPGGAYTVGAQSMLLVTFHEVGNLRIGPIDFVSTPTTLASLGSPTGPLAMARFP